MAARPRSRSPPRGASISEDEDNDLCKAEDNDFGRHGGPLDYSGSSCIVLQGCRWNPRGGTLGPIYFVRPGACD